MTLVNDGIFEEVTVGADLFDQEVLDSELLLNGGFEILDGPDDFADWNEIFGGSSTVEDETLVVHSGNHAVKFTFVDDVNTYVRQTITVTPQTNYKLTFWTRGDGSVEGRYRVYDISNSKSIIGPVVTGITGTTYTQRAIYFSTPAGCSSIYIFMYAPSFAGIAYFDDVSVREVTAPRKGSFNALTAGSSELGANIGFEIAGAGPPVFLNWSEIFVGNDTIEDETSDINTGSHAAKITNVDNGGTNVNQNITVTANTFYKFSFYVRGDGSVSGRVRIRDINNAADLVATVSVGVAGTGYVLKTYYVYSPTGCTTINLKFYAPLTAGSAYFDDISIKKINTAWKPLLNNTMALVDDGNGGEALEIIWVNHSNGAQLYLQESYDLNANPVQGGQIKLTGEAKINTGDCNLTVRRQGPAITETVTNINSASFTPFTYYYNTGSVSSFLQFAGLGTGEKVTLNNFKVEPVTLDEWAENNGWGPATDGSGLQVDKAYFYKGTGVLSQDIGAEAGKIYHLGYTLDNEDALLLDEPFDDWTGDDPDGWTVSESIPNSEISEVGPTEGHGGTGTGACNIQSDGTGAYIQKAAFLTIGKTYGYSINITKVVSGEIKIQFGASAGDTYSTPGVKTGKVEADSTGLIITRIGTPPIDITFDDIKIWECVVPEIGGTEGTPEYEDGTYVEDILAINTDPLKFIAETSMEFTIDDVEAFSEVTIYVDKDATGAADGTSWQDAFITIQAGINDAAGGDHVVCAPGIYTGAGNVNLDYGPAPNGFRVSSLFPLQAVIDGEGAIVRGFFFNNGEGNDSIAEGFIITRCGSNFGAGIRASACSPTIRYTWFKNNFSNIGAGLYVDTAGASPIIEICLFTGNNSTNTSGAIYTSGAVSGFILINSTITRNSAAVNVSGIDIKVTATITNVLIYDNVGGGVENNMLGVTPTHSIYDFDNTVSDTPGTGCLDAAIHDPRLNSNFIPQNPLVSKGGVDSIYSDLVRDIYGIQLTDISGNWLRGFGPMGAALNLPGPTISPVITNVITDVITEAVLGENN